MIKRPLLLMLLLASTMVLTYQASATESPELRKILKAHVDAMGGWKNWDAIESIRQTGNIERDGQTIEFCIVKKRPNMIRATLTMAIPGKEDEAVQVIRAHDGKEAWTATRQAGAQTMQKAELTGHAATELLADASVLPKLIQLWRAGAALKIAEYPNQSNQSTTTIQATLTETLQMYTFHLNERYETTDYTYQNPNGSKIHTRLSQYKTINGISLPMLTQIESKQTGTSTMTTDAIELGVGIYQDYFDSNDHTNATIVTVK